MVDWQNKDWNVDPEAPRKKPATVPVSTPQISYALHGNESGLPLLDTSKMYKLL